MVTTIEERENLKKLIDVNYKVYTKDDAIELFQDRDIYIWGAGQKGRGFYMTLRRVGFEVKGFLDMSPLLKGKKVYGIPIYDPIEFLKNRNKNAYILVASVDIRNKEIFKICESYGLEKYKDFINIQYLCPYYPVIEVSGVCNLRCISCPRSDPKYFPQKGGFMKASDYERIIKKLITDIPFTYLVDLYIWGEPFLNPDLPEIVEINNQLGIASGISSNLNVNPENIEKVIMKNPPQIRVSVSGFGDTHYEITHTKGKWEKFYSNLLLIKKLIEKHNADTIIEVYYHVNRENIEEGKKMKELCNRLNFKFHPSIYLILPDLALSQIEREQLSENSRKTFDLLLIPFDELIEKAKNEREKTCLLKRILPVINWDGSVLACCNYSYDRFKLADSYLNVSLDEIIKMRNENPFCIKCRKYSLHRYFDPVYYSKKVESLLMQ